MQESLNTESSSASEIELDEGAVIHSFKTIGGSAYAQVNATKDMWVSCSAFRELDDASVAGRKFGSKVAHFRWLADELFWDVPAGLIVVNLDRENATLFKSGRQPASIAMCPALMYLRSWAGMGFVMLDYDKIVFSRMPLVPWNDSNEHSPLDAPDCRIVESLSVYKPLASSLT